MTRVALYARYSSDNQRDASIEDQLRICREKAEREKWTIVCSYTVRETREDMMKSLTNIGRQLKRGPDLCRRHTLHSLK